jgi:hypothetical protein
MNDYDNYEVIRQYPDGSAVYQDGIFMAFCHPGGYPQDADSTVLHGGTADLYLTRADDAQSATDI